MRFFLTFKGGAPAEDFVSVEAGAVFATTNDVGVRFDTALGVDIAVGLLVVLDLEEHEEEDKKFAVAILNNEAGANKGDEARRLSPSVLLESKCTADEEVAQDKGDIT